MGTFKGKEVWRYWIYGIIVSLLFGIWTSQLWILQLVRGQSLASEAQQVFEREVPLEAKRGLIYYRDGQTPIVNNVDYFNVYITPGLLEQSDIERELSLLASILGVPRENLERSLQRRFGLLQPVLLAENIALDKIQNIAEQRDRLRGVTYRSRPKRNMVRDGSIIHVVGYVGDISDGELEILYDKQQYRRNANIGKIGIEQYYDGLLRGRNGNRIERVDASGNVLEESLTPPQMGADLVLTIDQHIQELAENALGDHPGTVVVMRPETGEVLAMVSAPWYSLSDFDSADSYQKVLEDPRKPLLNRTISSSYPPASTFKLVTATAILATDAFAPKAEILDRGSWRLGDRIFHCWFHPGHGRVNLLEAIIHSCNIYFGRVGVEHVGEESILHYAAQYGFGRPTGIDLLGEVSGLVPSAGWKQDKYKEIWTRGDTLNITIGQGFLLVTPIQEAVYISALVNGGPAYKPFLLKELLHPNSEELAAGESETVRSERSVLLDVDVDRKVFDQIKLGMRKVVTEGTARGTILNGVVDVAAKTGTAEIGLVNNWHSWFASYAPYKADDPMDRVVVITQVEADPRYEEENYDWWAPKAADIIYRGIFANETYEEVWLNYKKRRVWFHSLMKVPEKYAAGSGGESQ